MEFNREPTPLKVGDKVIDFRGNKGVVTRVIHRPDYPTDKVSVKGDPTEYYHTVWSLDTESD